MDSSKKISNLRNYALLAGAVIGIPLLYDLDGSSASQARYVIEEQRQVLATMSKKPEFSENLAELKYGGNVKDIEQNLEYLDSNRKTLEKITRFGLDFSLGMLVLTGIASGAYLKKNLENLFKSN